MHVSPLRTQKSQGYYPQLQQRHPAQSREASEADGEISGVSWSSAVWQPCRGHEGGQGLG